MEHPRKGGFLRPKPTARQGTDSHHGRSCWVMKGRRPPSRNVVYYLAEDSVSNEGRVAMQIKNSGRRSIWGTGVLGVFLMAASFTAAQTPSPTLLVLEKSDNSMAI